MKTFDKEKKDEKNTNVKTEINKETIASKKTQCKHHWFKAKKLGIFRCNLCGEERKIEGGLK